MTETVGTNPVLAKKASNLRNALLLILLPDALIFLLFYIMTQGGGTDPHSVLPPELWLINVIMDYVVFVPLGFTLFLTTRQYTKWKYRHALYMMFAWLLLIISNVFRVIEKTLTYVTKVTFVLYIPITFFMLLLIDSISRESVEPVKIIIASVLSVLYVTNQQSLFIGLLVMFLISIATYYILIIYWNAPASLKRQARLALVGCVIFGFGNMVIAYSKLEYIFPGATSLSSAIGYFIYAISFVREPRLAYILPFRVISLTVFETTGGIPVFSHTWKKTGEFIDDSLFSGMLQGIGLVLDEMINAGDLEEIKTSRAVLLIKKCKTHSIACVLVTTRYSRTLRLALHAFAEKFFAKYQQFVTKTIETSQFASASTLVDECFAFIPTYD
nr:hypothetical protein [Candidatus Sigynarchaeota archaeon]